MVHKMHHFIISDDETWKSVNFGNLSDRSSQSPHCETRAAVTVYTYLEMIHLAWDNWLDHVVSSAGSLQLIDTERNCEVEDEAVPE